MAQLQFEREQNQLLRGFQRPQVERQFFQGRQNLPGQFVGRGTLHSGLYSSALQQFAEDEAFGLGAFDIQSAQQEGQFAFQQQGIESNIGSIQAEAARQRQQARSQVAQRIQEII